ncbi:MAG: O-antigen ligase family protein [Thermodesulfovibrionales bacterium]|nr:O-antigen ligase family protein [Thermodesulfovibrionales bacterium]
MSLWLSINTGPWTLKETPHGMLETLHFIRTISPFFVLMIAGSIAFGKKGDTAVSGPLRSWLLYGFVSLFAGFVMSPGPFDAAYWGFIYLSVFAALNVYVKGHDALNRAVHINYLSWIVTGLFLSILLFIAKDALFIETRQFGLTGYGVEGRVQAVAEMPMSRSSGLARFSAIPGVVSFVFLVKGGVLRRLVWAGIFLFSFSLIYLLQSRGAILCFGFALSFVMLFFGRRTRAIGIVFLIVVGLLLFTNIIPEDFVKLQFERFMRGQDVDEFYTITGRTMDWKIGWRIALDSPFIGWGPQADRMLAGGLHIHNTYLYALLTSGFLGAAFFAGGLLYAWLLFFRLLKGRAAEKFNQKVFFIQAGGVLAFFTGRSIPEVSGAMFGVDSMLMIPVIVYLTILYKQYKTSQAVQNEAGAKQRVKYKIRW